MKLLICLAALLVAVSAGHILKSDPRCPPVDGDYAVYFRDDTMCGVFYKCSNGEAHRFVCPGGLHFDTVKNVCNWPDKVDCDDGSDSGQHSDGGDVSPLVPVKAAKPTKSAAPASETAKASTVDGNCAIVPSDQYVQFPDPTDCSKFYICSNGQAEKRSCPPGLNYNRVLQVCDYPDKAGCDEVLEYRKAKSH